MIHTIQTKTKTKTKGEGKRTGVYRVAGFGPMEDSIYLNTREARAAIQANPPVRGKLYWLWDGTVSIRGRVYLDALGRWYAIQVGHYCEGHPHDPDFCPDPLPKGKPPF